MHKEIETRFLNVDKSQLISMLKGLGAIDDGENKLLEYIFYDRDLKWVDENKFVRLRQNGAKLTMTFKQNNPQKIDSANEIEYEISDIEKARELLQNTGLRLYRVVEKYRHTFTIDNVTVDIDTWPKIPVYVELEGTSVEDLEKISSKLGFNWNDKFDKDARYVYQKYGFDFDKLTCITFDKFE